MSDTVSKEKRTQIMASVKGKDTKAEIIVRKFLHHKGFRYRKNVSKLPGCPDIVLNKYKTVIFIHGCFWHGHDACKKLRIPKTNTEYWLKKIDNNKKRDLKIKKDLQDSGWNVIIIWECELEKQNEGRLERLIQEIKNSAHI